MLDQLLLGPISPVWVVGQNVDDDVGVYEDSHLIAAGLLHPSIGGFPTLHNSAKFRKTALSGIVGVWIAFHEDHFVFPDVEIDFRVRRDP